jgi:hypothetical protein
MFWLWTCYSDVMIISILTCSVYVLGLGYFSYDLGHRTSPHISWRHVMNKKQKLSSVAHLIIVSFVDNISLS